MEITISNRIKVHNVPQDLMAELKNRLSFTNPAWIENDRRGYWNGKTARVLRFYDVLDNGTLVIPRGFAAQLLSLSRKYNANYQITDSRRTLDNVDFNFNGTLRRYQGKAVSDVLGHDFGVLSSPPGSGKTTMCLFCIAERAQPALVIVHTRELMLQWVSRIEQFLGIPKEQVGIIGGGQKKIGDRITVALIQSLYKCTNEISKHIGFLICDEVHRAPARCFSEAISSFDSRYMLGLSATPWRRDGLSKLIYWFCGDVAHEIKAEDLVKSKDILKAEVTFRETSFDTRLNASEQYSKVLSELTIDAARNKLIVKDVIREANNGSGTILILSDRKNHCEEFKVLLRGHGIKAELLTGDVSNKDREKIVERLNDSMVKVLIATGQLIGEGFDCPGLSTLFLTTPIKFDGRVIQYLGRVLRPAQGKEKAKVYDYIDGKVGVLRASAKARGGVYQRQDTGGQAM